MKLKSLEEISLRGTTPEVNKLFSKVLKKVFNVFYLQKIEDNIKKRIKIVSKNMSEKEYAYVYPTNPNRIYINSRFFEPGSEDELEENQKIKILLHEFTHSLQLNRKFFFFRNFKQINEVGKRIRPIINKYSPDPSYFLTGRKRLNIGAAGIKNEVLPYLMTNSIKWDGIKNPGKELVIKELRRSGIFNLSSSFWRERLG